MCVRTGLLRLEQAQPVTYPTNHIARLPDPDSLVGRCPDLPPGWADVAFATDTDPTLTAAWLAADPLVVHGSPDRPCHLIVSGGQTAATRPVSGLGSSTSLSSR